MNENTRNTILWHWWPIYARNITLSIKKEKAIKRNSLASQPSSKRSSKIHKVQSALSKKCKIWKVSLCYTKPENLVKIYQWPQTTISGCGECQNPKHQTSWQLSQIQPELELKIPTCLHIQCFVPRIQIRWICQWYPTARSLSNTQSSAKVKSSENKPKVERPTY